LLSLGILLNALELRLAAKKKKKKRMRMMAAMASAAANYRALRYRGRFFNQSSYRLDSLYLW